MTCRNCTHWSGSFDETCDVQPGSWHERDGCARDTSIVFPLHEDDGGHVAFRPMSAFYVYPQDVTVLDGDRVLRGHLTNPKGGETIVLEEQRQEEPMQDLTTWIKKFEAIEAASTTAVDKAEAIMREAIAEARSDTEIEKLGKRLCKTLESGKEPKRGPARNEAMSKPAAVEPPSDADPMAPLRARREQLTAELEGVDAKRAELARIERTIEAWEGAA